jgi:hypothetical protein
MEKTCEWHQSGDGLVQCMDTEIIAVKINQTDSSTGESAETLLGYMCRAHALTWMREHVINTPSLKETPDA